MRIAGTAGLFYFTLVFTSHLACSQDDLGQRPDEVATSLNPVRQPVYQIALHNLTFSPTGKLAAGQGSGAVYLWDLETGEQTNVIQAHTNWAFSIVFESDGKHMWTGGGDGLVKRWDMQDLQQPVETLDGHGSADIHAIVLQEAKKRLVTAGDDMRPIVWQESQPQPVASLPTHPRQITSMDLNSAGHLATGSRDGRVRIYDLQSEELLAEMDKHTGDVMSVRFVPGKDLLVSGSYDQQVYVWDTVDNRTYATHQHHRSAVVCVDVNPSGDMVASVDDQSICFFDLRDDTAQLTMPKLKRGEQLSFVRFSPDGKEAAVTTTAGRILRIDAHTRRVTAQLVPTRKRK